MTIRVNLIEDGRFAEILSDGYVTRREAGWATERVREMVEAREVARQPEEAGVPGRGQEVVQGGGALAALFSGPRRTARLRGATGRCRATASGARPSRCG